MEISGQHHTPTALDAGQKPGTHYIKGGVRSTAGIEGFDKNKNHLLSLPRFETRNVQPSHYNDCVILASSC
jgi:hypothetical protein